MEHDDGLAAVAELGAVGVAAVDAQAERALVPGDGAVEVGDREVDGAEPERRGGSAGGAGRSELVSVKVMRSMMRPPGRRRNGRRPRDAMDFGRARALAVGRRRLAVVALERAREVQLVVEAGAEGDLADRQVAEAQQPRGLEHHAVGDQLLGRRGR